ncbi:MAG: TolC family protein [Helicobacteraceae bacterium]|nr:TolC family protein [Helicobacteraceae bacterium]
MRPNVIVLALFFVQTLFAQELGSSLEELLAYARERNPRFEAIEGETSAAFNRVGSAGALDDPRFRVEFRDMTKMGDQSPTLSPSRVGSVRYLLMQDIPWYGKRDLKREVAASLARSIEQGAKGEQNAIEADIKTTYAELFYLEENIRLTREIEAILAQTEAIAQKRYALGISPQKESIDAAIERSELQNDLIALETKRVQLKAKMNALLGRDLFAPLLSPESIAPLPNAAKIDYAALRNRVQNAPRLLAKESQIEAAQRNKELAYKNRYPDFTLGVSPIQYGDSIKEWELMIEFNIPLGRTSLRSEQMESDATLLAARSQKEAEANEVMLELYENAADYESALRSIALIDETLTPQTKLAFASALAGYETGKTDFAQLLQAQNRLRQARRSAIAARLQARIALAQIERVLGEGL